MKKIFIFSILLMLFCSKENVPKDGVVSVNGTWITQGEIDKIVEMYREQMTRMMPQQALQPVPPEVKKNVAMQLIANELVLQEAKKRRIGCDSGKVETTFAGIVKQFPDAITMKNQLARMGQTEQTLRGQIKDGLTVDSLMKTLFKKSDTATALECKTYYDGNKSQFASEKRIKASQILLLVKKEMSADQKKDVADKAKKILAELRAGKDFGACAKKYSQDPNASTGGDIGWFKKGDIKPEFEKVAMTLKSNEISDVFETDVGFHIIKKTGEENLPPKSFDEVRPQIKNMIELKKHNDVVKQFVDSLFSISKITYADTAYKPLNGSIGK
ncbi:MAG: peptidylprolyl isomerase [Chitinivibrionales bacterium]